MKTHPIRQIDHHGSAMSIHAIQKRSSQNKTRSFLTMPHACIPLPQGIQLDYYSNRLAYGQIDKGDLFMLVEEAEKDAKLPGIYAEPACDLYLISIGSQERPMPHVLLRRVSGDLDGRPVHGYLAAVHQSGHTTFILLLGQATRALSKLRRQLEESIDGVLDPGTDEQDPPARPGPSRTYGQALASFWPLLSLLGAGTFLTALMALGAISMPVGFGTIGLTSFFGAAYGPWMQLRRLDQQLG